MLSALATLPALANSLPAGHSRIEIAEGTAGIAQTITQMQKLVANGKRDIRVRTAIRPIIDSCADKDYYNYARKLHEWVRDNIKYVYDPHQVEYLEAPDVLLRTKIGDCDSQDILLASLFEQCGLKSQFVTVAADPSRPGEYTHVYVRVYIPKVGWVSADPIMKNKPFGWEAEDDKISARRYWPASTDDANEQLDTRPSVKVGGDNPFDPGQLFGLGRYVNKQVMGKPDPRIWPGWINSRHLPMRRNTMGDLGHRGGHGGGRRGGFGPGWSGGWGWSGDTYVIEQPVIVPAVLSDKPYTMIPTDYPIAVNNSSVSFIPAAPTNPEMNDPRLNQSVTLSGFSGCGQRDDATVSRARDFVNGTTLGAIKSMSEEYQKNLDAWSACTNPETKATVLVLLKAQHDDYTAASGLYDQILKKLRDEATNPIIGGTINQVLDRLDNPNGLGNVAIVAAIGIAVLAILNVDKIAQMLDSIGMTVKSFLMKDAEVKSALAKPVSDPAGIFAKDRGGWIGLVVVGGAALIAAKLLGK